MPVPNASTNQTKPLATQLAAPANRILPEPARQRMKPVIVDQNSIRARIRTGVAPSLWETSGETHVRLIASKAATARLADIKPAKAIQSRTNLIL